MLKFANWCLFAVFAISRVVCGKKMTHSYGDCQKYKNRSSKYKDCPILNCLYFFDYSILKFRGKIWPLLHLNATRPL